VRASRAACAITEAPIHTQRAARCGTSGGCKAAGRSRWSCARRQDAPGVAKETFTVASDFSTYEHERAAAACEPGRHAAHKGRVNTLLPPKGILRGLYMETACAARLLARWFRLRADNGKP